MAAAGREKIMEQAIEAMHSISLSSKLRVMILIMQKIKQ
jgi:hypothetical protein